MRDFWTVCIYELICERRELRCIAHQRSVDCSIENARLWPVGVGIGGIAAARKVAVVCPDLYARDAGTALHLAEEMAEKDTDREHYRSMMAVPIMVGPENNLWGVVVATSSKPSHFGGKALGLEPEETVRALAGIVALAVAVVSPKNS